MTESSGDLGSRPVTGPNPLENNVGRRVCNNKLSRVKVLTDEAGNVG